MIGKAQAKRIACHVDLPHDGRCVFDANHFARRRSVALAVRVLMAAMTIGRREMITYRWQPTKVFFHEGDIAEVKPPKTHIVTRKPPNRL